MSDIAPYVDPVVFRGEQYPDDFKELYFKVLDFAMDAHYGQFRKTISGNTKVPYINHPIRVANMVYQGCANYGHTSTTHPWTWTQCQIEHSQILALLHDVVEDTKMVYSDIRNLIDTFDTNKLIIADNLIKDLQTLTYDETVFPDKMKYIENVFNNGSPEAIYVKLLDRLQNIESMVYSPWDGKKKMNYIDDAMYMIPLCSQRIQEEISNNVYLSKSNNYKQKMWMNDMETLTRAMFDLYATISITVKTL